jgi:hypothetical protein
MTDRKVVRACYTSYDYYVIPTGLDLEDKSVVSSWGIKWGKLWINLANGKELCISQPAFEQEVDHKFPDSTEIIEQEETILDDDAYTDVDTLWQPTVTNKK